VALPRAWRRVNQGATRGNLWLPAALVFLLLFVPWHIALPFDGATERDPLDHFGGPDGFGYIFVDNQGEDTASFNWIELRGDPEAVWLDFGFSHGDGIVVDIPIGFQFPFYGYSFDLLTVGVEGTFQFLTTTRRGGWSCPPMNAINCPAIFPFRAELDVDYGGNGIGNDITVGYKRFEDYIVIEYDSIGRCCDESSSYKFEAILYRSGRIKFQYDRLTEPVLPTIAIQADPNGPALMYGCGALGIHPVESLAIWISLRNSHPDRVTDLAGTADGTFVSLEWNDPVQDTNGNPLVPDSVYIYRGLLEEDSIIGRIASGVQTFSVANQPVGYHAYYVRAKFEQRLGTPEVVWVFNGVPNFFTDFEDDNTGISADFPWVRGAITNPEGPAAYSGESVIGIGMESRYDLGTCANLTLDSGLRVTSNIAKLEFWAWWNMGLLDFQHDGLIVSASTDDGVTWELLNPAGGYTDFVIPENLCLNGQMAWGGFSHGWRHIVIDVGHLFNTTPIFRITFGSYGIDEQYGVGVFIDDLSLWGFGPSPDGKPERVQDLTASGNGSDGLTLSWLDPTHDTNGNQISIDSVRIYRNLAVPDSQVGSVSAGTQVFTIHGQQQGYKEYFARAIFDQNTGLPNSAWSVVGRPSYYDGFEESNGGWSAESDWEWGVPTNPSGPHAHSGNKVWAVGLNEVYDASACGDLVLEPAGRIISPNARLELWFWRSCEVFGDGCNVSISLDGGQVWQRIAPIGDYNGIVFGGGCTPGQSVWQGTDGAPWQHAVFELGQFVGESPVLRLRFGADGFGDSYSGFFLDDVMLWGIAPEQGVVGQVVDGSNGNVPLPGVWVNAEVDSVQTDGAGYYVLPLPPGTYDLRFTSPHYCDSVVTGLVVGEGTIDTVNAALLRPRLDVDTSSISFFIVSESQASSDLVMFNSGDCPLQIEISDNADWLSVSPIEGVVPEGDEMIVTITVSSHNITGGEYNALLSILTNSLDSFVNIPVVLDIASAMPGEREIPDAFVLDQVYPSPFNSTVTIRFGLPTGSEANITIYDILGRKVETLANQVFPPGWHELKWNAALRPTGVYFVRLLAEGVAVSTKLLLLR